MQILGEEAADKVVEDLKFDLQVLNAAMKKLDADWDFTATITPLLSDQGHALAVAAKLKRQIERMTRLRDQFLQQKQAEEMPAKPAGKMPDKPSGSCQPTPNQCRLMCIKTELKELTSVYSNRYLQFDNVRAAWPTIWLCFRSGITEMRIWLPTGSCLILTGRNSLSGQLTYFGAHAPSTDKKPVRLRQKSLCWRNGGQFQKRNAKKLANVVQI